jgi:ribA/ribD-fused uncharacterized protein
MALDNAERNELNSRVYFNFRRGSVLSNMHADTVMYWGIPFRSAEHAYQWAKCTLIGNGQVARQVEQASSPLLAKTYAKTRLTREDREEWRNSPAHLRVMYDILCCKYHSNVMFRNVIELFDTCYFCEETNDKYWGIGCQQKVANGLSIEQLPGENVLGRLLMLLAKTKGNNVDNYTWEEFRRSLDYDALKTRETSS